MRLYVCVYVGYCVVDDGVVIPGKVPYIDKDGVTGFTAGDKILHVGDHVDWNDIIILDECNQWLELLMSIVCCIFIWLYRANVYMFTGRLGFFQSAIIIYLHDLGLSYMLA